MVNHYALQPKVTASKVFYKNRSTIVLLALLTVALGIGVSIWFPKKQTLPVGVTAPGQPLQQSLERPASWVKDDYTVTALASYQLTARILGKKSYRNSDNGDLAPYDLALGWAEMSDSSILNDLKISQSGRWFYVYWKNPPIEPSRIMQNSANTHILPANDAIAQQVQDLRPDQIVFLKGHLVEVSKQDGFSWRSSLTRGDTGNGSCEIFWVEDLEIQNTSSLQAQR
jgi:hypothetical protein